MWRPPVNFVTLHYAYIILISLLAIPILYPEGNLSAINSYHFGVSSATESGLNTVDVKDLKTYQQVYLYIVPTVTNIGFVNIIVVVVRLWWFRKHLKKLAPALFEAKREQVTERGKDRDAEETLTIGNRPESYPERPALVQAHSANEATALRDNKDVAVESEADEDASECPPTDTQPPKVNQAGDGEDAMKPEKPAPTRTHIKFDAAAERHPKNDATLYIPGPRDRDRGEPLVELSTKSSVSYDDRDQDDGIRRSMSSQPALRRRRTDGSRLAEAKSFDRVATVASSMFVIGPEQTRRERRLSGFSQTQSQPQPALNEKPFLSRQATIGRNSQFRNLTSDDREALGGIEYRSLKLLLKIVVGFFFGMHLFGAICLIPWIMRAPAKYKDYLDSIGQGKVWWAIYSAQTMVNNLGFTLTPDSMVTFRDAEWPMFVMSLLAFAGNTFYPVFLRLVIWTMTKILPKKSPTQDPLNFLLEHPRRCYTLLFPSGPTWVLFAILFALNFIDTVLIITLDLHNPAVASLPLGKRVLAAIFQAASARHTGTSSFALADVSPAVQFSLLVMMYISVFPIAISIRASNTYEERALGIYEKEAEVGDEAPSGTAYLLKHMQNQLSFDLWYIFLGIFCISISEASKIMDMDDPATNMFSIFFEVTSAYGNVGLSLGHPGVNVSLCGTFNTFSKVIICLLMIRGRHRGLPYQLDRAIMLPDQHLLEEESTDRSE